MDRLFTGISNSIIANVYGCLAVGATQGTLLGLAFWVLGLPSPVLWGLVTALFSLIPVIGSAAVWGPAVIVLMVAGPWWKAVILLVWGAAVVGQIDSLVHQDDIARTVRLRLITRVHAGLRPVDGGLEPSPTSKVGLQSFVSPKASGETQLRPAD